MFKRLITVFVCLAFSFSNFQYVQAQDFNVNQLPVPGTMVGESTPFAPLALKGLVVNPQKPLEFQFLVDTGRGPQDTAFVKDQANQLVKYFLAGLTIPEGDLWVNLSPYEKNRMVPEALGQTDLGRDLLAQDYILKQLTASLIYPERDLGKEFWSRVYARAQAQFGTTNVPVNTFNKVWILPDQAQVYDHTNAAYVTKSTLKVMLDEDYLAKQQHHDTQAAGISSRVVRAIILPEIVKEVNTGKNFAPLRQIYQALILAKWYKQAIQNGLLDALYTNKEKIAGVNLDDPAVKDQIYERYISAYKKGAFNYIKMGGTPDGKTISRKYFSGGISRIEPEHVDTDGAMSAVKSDGAMLSLTVALVAAQRAQIPQEKKDAALISEARALHLLKIRLDPRYYPKITPGDIQRVIEFNGKFNVTTDGDKAWEEWRDIELDLSDHKLPYSPGSEEARIEDELRGRQSEIMRDGFGIGRFEITPVGPDGRNDAALELKRARAAALYKAQELVDFLADRNGQEHGIIDDRPFDAADAASGIRPVIHAVGSPAPQSFYNAAKFWEQDMRILKEKGIKDPAGHAPIVPIVITNGRGRGYKRLVMNTFKFIEAKKVELAQAGNTVEVGRIERLVNSFKQQFSVSLTALEKEYPLDDDDKDSLDRLTKAYHVSGPDNLNEAQAIKLLFELGSKDIPQEAFFLEQQSNSTFSNMILAYPVLKSAIDKTYGPGARVKIHLIADAFHRMRAILQAKKDLIAKNNLQGQWLINGDAAYYPDFSAMDDQDAYAYLKQMIGDPNDTKPPFGEIGRLSIKYAQTDHPLEEFITMPDAKSLFYWEYHQWKGGGAENLRTELLKEYRDAIDAAMVSDESYQNYATALNSLITLDDKQLNEILPGRRDKKYYSVTLQPLPFEGISVIHNISHQESKRMKLSLMAQELESDLKAAGLGGLVAFVDLNSFHATTFDLINEPETRASFGDSQKNPQGYVYSDVRAQIMQKTQEFLRQGDGEGYSAPSLSAKVQITGVGMFAPGIVKLNLKMTDDQDAENFRVFREKLQAFLIKQVPGYSLVREKVGKLAGHITIGYVVNKPATKADVDKFIGVLRQINQKFEPGGEFSGIEFNLTQGEVTHFSDMNHYTTLEEAMRVIRSWNFPGDPVRRAVDAVISSGDQTFKKEANLMFSEVMAEKFSVQTHVDWDHASQLEDGRVEMEQKAFEDRQAFAREMLGVLNGPDVAVLGKTNGGIDFNRIQITHNAGALNMKFDPIQLNTLVQSGFEGFTPVIINIKFIQSPLSWLGIASAH